MLNVILASVLGLMFSSIGLVILGASSLKRHRKGRPRILLNRCARTVVTVFVLLPVCMYAFTGNFSALLIWLGLTTVTGWLIALAPTRMF